MQTSKVNHDYAECLAIEYNYNGYNEEMDIAEYLLAEFSTCSAPEKDNLEAFESMADAVAAYSEYIANNF